MRKGDTTFTDTHLANGTADDAAGHAGVLVERRHDPRSPTGSARRSCTSTSAKFGLGRADRRGPAGRGGRPGAAARRTGAGRRTARSRSGTSVDVTPLQMAAVYAAIANDGTWVQPHLVKAIDRAGRHGDAGRAAPQTRQVITPGERGRAAHMLEAVVTVPGATGALGARSTATGSPARPAPASGSSTASTPPVTSRRSSAWRRPTHPRYVVAVFAHTPGGERRRRRRRRRSREMMEYTLRHYRVPPTGDQGAEVHGLSRDGVGDVSAASARGGACGRDRVGSERRVRLSASPCRRRRPARAISPRCWRSPAARPARTRRCTGVTHASGEVRPGDLYAALPGARRHGAEFVAGRARRRRGRGADRPGRRGRGRRRPACRCWSSTTRARCSARSPSAVYGDPTARLTVIGITGTAGKTSTAYLVESGLRAAGPRHRPDRHGGDPARRPGRRQRPHHARRPPTCTRCSPSRRERGVDRGRHGGVQPRAGDGPGRRGPVRRRRLHQLRPGPPRLPRRRRTTTSRPRRGCSTAAAGVEVLNLDDPALRPLLKPGHGHLLGRRRPGGRPGGPTTSTGDGFGQRFTAHGPDGVAVAAGVALPGRHNVANALLALAALVAVGVDPAIAADGDRRLPRRARPAGAGRRARRRCSASSTTRTSRTRSWPRWPRCASWPRPAAAG